MVLLDIEQGHAQHGAVGGNQGQVDAQHLVERRRDFADHHFGELNHRGDNQDKGQNSQRAQFKGLDEEMLQEPAP